MSVEKNDEKVETNINDATDVKWDANELYSREGQNLILRTEKLSSLELPAVDIGQPSTERSAKDMLDEHAALSFLDSWSRHLDVDKNGKVTREELESQYKDLTRGSSMDWQQQQMRYLLDNFDRLSKGNPEGINLAASKTMKAELKEEALIQTIKDLLGGKNNVDRRLSDVFPAEFLIKHTELADEINGDLNAKGIPARIEIQTQYHSPSVSDRPHTGQIVIKDASGNILHTIHARSMMMY